MAYRGNTPLGYHHQYSVNFPSVSNLPWRARIPDVFHFTPPSYAMPPSQKHLFPFPQQRFRSGPAFIPRESRMDYNNNRRFPPAVFCQPEAYHGDPAIFMAQNTANGQGFDSVGSVLNLSILPCRIPEAYPTSGSGPSAAEWAQNPEQLLQNNDDQRSLSKLMSAQLNFQFNDEHSPQNFGAGFDEANYTFPLEESRNDNEECPSSTTPMNRLSRIARFNRITPKYELVDEKGPAHRKVFAAKVVLAFGQTVEEFRGEGNSIKKAQHNAALSALECSKLRKLPDRNTRRIDHLNCPESPPVARLNALAQKMRSWADYKDICSPAPILWSFGNATVWNTSVTICGRMFNGWGATRTISRNMAAEVALEYFDREKQRREIQALPKPIEVPESVAEISSNKAPVSLIYEEARRRQLDVSFDCLGSEGLPHSLIHYVKCVMGDMEAIGQGSNKKIARHDAAEKMLVILNTDSTNQCAAVPNIMKRKSNPVKTAKARPDYGKNINPVSRLYQLQQAGNAPDPVFETVEVETVSGSKVKEFGITASIPGGPSIVGTGPNKRLAKRFAAENLLRVLGYHMQPPPPQKSSLREKPDISPESPPEPSEDPERSERKVKFALENPESEDKQNGRLYRRRFSKFPQPASMYPKESVQEVLYEATAAMRPGKSLAPGLISLPQPRGKQPGNDSLPISTISAIARELIVDQKSDTAQKVIDDGARDIDDIYEDAKSDYLHLLEYLCRVANMTLKHETFARQGPHSEFVTVLTVGDPIESIGCGGGPTEEDAMKDAAWNLLNVIAKQSGDYKAKDSETN